MSVELRVEKLKDKIDEVFDALLDLDVDDAFLDQLSEGREILHSAASLILRAQYGDEIRERRSPLNFGDDDGYDEPELSF